MIENLLKLFARDLEKLADEISAFRKEDNLWRIEGDIKNTAGNLCLHLIGNLNHFIGAVIGKTGYVRHRETEFTNKGIPRQEMIRSVHETKLIVIDSLEKMDSQLLSSHYPIDVFGEKMTFGYFLMHLISHLNYHLGQINYLRRILEKDEKI
jgi:uncharacterized damage-inducible protein DinB